MKYLGDIAFWFTAAFSVATMVILISSVRIKGQGFLLGFIILSLLCYATNYFPFLMLRNKLISYADYRKFSVPAEVVTTSLRSIAWAILFVFAIGLKGSIQQAPQRVAGNALRKGPLAQPMTIGRALFSFDGRLCRSDYWRKGILPLLPLNILNYALVHGRQDWGLNLAVFMSIAGLWPGLALISKRLHDRDQPAWHMLIILIPIVGPILLIVGVWFMKGTDGPNRFGPDPLRPGVAPGAGPVLASV